MANESAPLYEPKFALNIQFWVKAAREKIKAEWRSQHPNTMILTALIKFENKYSEARVPVCIKIVPGESVSLSEAQSKEIFNLLSNWLHPPGDIHLSSHTRRDMQRACIKRTLGQNRPYKVTCLNVVKEGYEIEVQLLNGDNERYPLSFVLKTNEPANYDDPPDSIVGEASVDQPEDQDEDQDGPSEPMP